MPYQPKREPLDPCPVEEVIRLVSGKWKARLLYHLAFGPHSFAQLRRAVPGITPQVLTTHLRDLTRDGILTRRIHPTGRRISTQYTLTPHGLSLIPVLEAVSQWGQARLHRLGHHWTPPAPIEENHRSRPTH